MLGLSPREARARFDAVIEFAELEEFADLKLKNYSSGMHVRLAFSVMIQVDADILLIDEVLAVGDAAFQQKCFDVFNRLRDEGKTILFVTHDMGAVQRFCHRAMLLERGELVAIGDPRDGRPASTSSSTSARRGARDGGRGRRAPTRASGDGSARDRRGVVRGRDGRAARHVRARASRCAFDARVRVHEPLERPVFAVADRQRAAPTRLRRVEHRVDQQRTGAFAAGEEVEFARELRRTSSRPAATSSSPLVAHEGTGTDVIDRWRSELASFVVAGTRAPAASSTCRTSRASSAPTSPRDERERAS